MQLFAHIGITLGSAWVLQKAVGCIKRNVSEQKLNYITTGGLGDHAVEVGSSSASTADWLDYRFLLLGSLLPDIIDKPLGIVFLGNGRTFCHTLLFTVLILAAGICLYRIRKSPGLFCIALGCVTHVLLDAMWLNQSTFLWPLYGWSFQYNDVSIGSWMERTFLMTKPSEYIPEAIGAISLVFVYFNLARNGKISRLLKSRLSVLYQSLFSGHKPKHVPPRPVLSKGARMDLGQSIGLIEKSAE